MSDNRFKVGDRVFTRSTGRAGIVDHIGIDPDDTNIETYLIVFDDRPDTRYEYLGKWLRNTLPPKVARRYAICRSPVRPVYDPYLVVATVTSDTPPCLSGSGYYVAVELKGYYKWTPGLEQGAECVQSYKQPDGTFTYVECIVDTSGT